jgi:UDP-GlcNAc:undecaprenyl-phosphate GlcNAc-1-phosphate transferase
LLACVNALNLIDGMDGFLGTVGGIALVSLAIIAAMTGHVLAASVALTLAAAVFGFLWWNLPPATIYMGDAGSMLIGFVVGAVAIPASLKGPATVALGAPLAVLVLPAFDTFAAVLRRKLTGRGLACPDRGHLHHKMMESGLRPSRVLMIASGLGLVAAAGALGSTAWNNDLFAFVAAGGVVAALVVGRLFGNAELGLVRARVSLLVRRFLIGDAAAWGMSVRLQGNVEWDQVWKELAAKAGHLNLQSLYLDVNVPALHENYHARWDNPVPAKESVLLRIEIPLQGRASSSLGQLAVVVARDSRPLAEVFASFAELVELLEHRVNTLTPPVIVPSSTTIHHVRDEAATKSVAAGV